MGVTDLRPYFTQIIGHEEVEEKTKKKTQTLTARISEKALTIFFKFGMWTPLPSRHFCSNFGFNRIRNHGATKV